MYAITIFLHSWLRWAVIALMAVSIALAAQKKNDDVAKKVSLFTLISVHLQVVLGLVLYLFLSPVTQAAFADFGAAMKDSATRYFAVEHIFGMLVGAVVLTIGHARAKRAADDEKAARTRLLFFVIADLVILLSIPWPGLAAARPLFRMF